jgi:hypothetical protein
MGGITRRSLERPTERLFQSPPRRRGSRVFVRLLDSRLRGNDRVGTGAAILILLAALGMVKGSIVIPPSQVASDMPTQAWAWHPGGGDENGRG